MILKKSKMPCINVFIILLITLISITKSHSYSGHADHRIAVIDRLNKEAFNPNQDLLKKTKLEEEWGDFHRTVSRSALESLKPLVSYIKDNDAVSNNILQSVIHSASLSFTRLSKEALKVFKEKQAYLPFYHDIYLLPSDETERNLFYSNDKITLNGIDQVNLLGVADESSNKFQKVSTENIKKLQKKYESSKDPFSLLAFRRSVILSEQEQNLRYIFLIQLQPREDAFVKESDKVNIKKIVIPDALSCNSSSAVALLTFNLNFDQQKEKTDPDLNIVFGSFDRYENGIFWLNHASKDKDKCIPKFEGEFAGKLGKLINITFGFKNIDMDLTKLEVSGLDILTRPGLKLGSNNSFAPVFFKADFIDKEFEGEFNKSIKDAMNSLLEKIFGTLKLESK